MKAFKTTIIHCVPNDRMDVSFRNILHWLNPIFVAVLMASIQFQMIQEAFGERIYQHIGAVYWNLEGIPILDSYQNRVLGPYMIEGFHKITGLSFETSYHVVYFLLLVTFYLVLFCVARSFFRTGIAPLATVFAAGFFNAFLMQGVWLYPWDMIHLILFTVTIWMILTRKPLWCIVVIIFIEIFNHSLRYVLAGWLVLDAVILLYARDAILPRVRFRLLRYQLVAGLLLGICGYFITEYLNDAMRLSPGLEQAIRQHYADLIAEHDAQMFVFGNIGSMLPESLNMLKSSFLFQPEADFWMDYYLINNPIIFNILILSILPITIWAILTKNNAIIRLGILYLILWGAVFGACPIYEVRVWLPFVPFLVLVVPLLYSSRFGGFNSRLWANDSEEKNTTTNDK